MKNKILCITAFFSAVIISISLLSISAFATASDIFTPVTINNMLLGGLSYFDSSIAAVDFQDYVRKNCSSREYCLWVSPVIYDESNKHYYVPVTSSDSYNTIEMNFFFDKYDLCNYFHSFGANGSGSSSAFHKPADKYPDYANYFPLSTITNSDGDICLSYQDAYGINSDGTFKFYASKGVALRWITIIDGEFVTAGEGLDSPINSSSVKWVCMLRPYSSWKKTLGIQSIFELFDDTGLVNTDNTVSNPEIAFPRYPTSAFDKTGFYVDSLGSSELHFYIKDNNNHHKYSLKIDSAINYKNTGNDSLIDVNIMGGDYSTFYYDYYWINDDFVNNPQIPTPLRNAVKDDVLDRWKNSSFTYSYKCKVAPNCMDFSAEDSPVASGYSFSLYDYINVSEGQFFLISAIDETEQRCLSQWAVASSDSHAYSPTPYPFKRTNFSNNAFSSQLPTGSDFNSHNFFNDTSYSTGMETITSSGDDLSDLENNKFNEYGTGDNFNFNADINDLSTAFSTSLASVRSFFSLCLGLIPASIITIVIGAISLLVVLRILGR